MLKLRKKFVSDKNFARFLCVCAYKMISVTFTMENNEKKWKQQWAWFFDAPAAQKTYSFMRKNYISYQKDTFSPPETW